MANHECRLVRAFQATAGNDDASRIVQREVGRDPSSDHAVTANDQDVAITHAVTPRSPTPSPEKIPLEIALPGAVGNPMSRTTSRKYDLVGKIRIEGRVIDLTNNRR